MRLDKCKHAEFIADLREAYFSILYQTGQNVKQDSILEMTVNKPAKSFYVSFDEGSRIINNMERGECIRVSQRQVEKCKDLYGVFLRIKEEFPLYKREILIRMSIESEAPKFYLHPLSARNILRKNIRI